MIKKIVFAAALGCAAFTNGFAGGILTNTNQNVAFLRNPARDGAIGIDGTYSNPAGVAFLDEGTHLSINWQAAWQTRTIETTNPVFGPIPDDNDKGYKGYLGNKDFNGQPQTYEGKASAPFIPSVQAAYNKDRWSFQFNFSVTGGGGKCEFANGLGSFEGAVGQIAAGLNKFGVAAGLPNAVICNGYDCNSYMQGKQYYFGFTMGAAYKVTDYLSLYGGIRVLYGSATYKAKIDNIKVITAANPEGMDFGQYYDQLKPYIDAAAQVSPAARKLQAVESYREGVNLQSDQSGVGFAPILGADLKLGKFNLAVKYEFRTKMNMENKSTVKEAHAIDAVNVFRDGTSIREDQAIVIEGIHALNPKLSEGIDDKDKFRIYISPLTQLNIDMHHRIPTTDARLFRRLVRDHRTRGRSAATTIHDWPAVRHGEDDNIFPYNSEADAFFNSHFIYELAVLKKYAQPLLEEITPDLPEYPEAQRYLGYLKFFVSLEDETAIPCNSIIREFIGGSVLTG